jgi:hypothetical protein
LPFLSFKYTYIPIHGNCENVMIYSKEEVKTVSEIKALSVDLKIERYLGRPTLITRIFISSRWR